MSSHLSILPQLDFDPSPDHLPTQRIRESPDIRKHQEKDGKNSRRNSYLPKVDRAVVTENGPVLLVKVHTKVSRNERQGQEDERRHRQLSHGLILR